MSKLWDKKASEVSAEEFALIEAEERLVYETQKAIRALMKARKVNASKMAKLLGVSEARVSQMLGANALNLTLRTIARIYQVLGSEAIVTEVSQVKARQAAAETTRLDQAATGKNKRKEQGDPWAEMFGMKQDIVELPALAAGGSDAIWVLGPMIAPARREVPIRTRNFDAIQPWLETSSPSVASNQAYAYAQ